jgi:hypothetical protein
MDAASEADASKWVDVVMEKVGADPGLAKRFADRVVVDPWMASSVACASYPGQDSVAAVATFVAETVMDFEESILRKALVGMAREA